MQIPIKILADFFVEIDKLVRNFVWKGKGPRTPKIKKYKGRGLTVPDAKTYRIPSYRNQNCVLLT